MIKVSDEIELDEKFISLDFIKASGPGGQNVNKVATAVRLRFDVERSVGISRGIKLRLKKIVGDRLTSDGILIIKASRFRTQDQNRQDAVNRLVAFIRKASIKPKKRIRTRPTRASRERTLVSKKKRGLLKKMRNNRIDR